MSTGRHYPLEKIEEINQTRDWPVDGPTSASLES
jgi:hypothetical protein